MALFFFSASVDFRALSASIFFLRFVTFLARAAFCFLNSFRSSNIEAYSFSSARFSLLSCPLFDDFGI